MNKTLQNIIGEIFIIRISNINNNNKWPKTIQLCYFNIINLYRRKLYEGCNILVDYNIKFASNLNF